MILIEPDNKPHPGRTQFAYSIEKNDTVFSVYARRALNVFSHRLSVHHKQPGTGASRGAGKISNVHLSTPFINYHPGFSIKSAAGPGSKKPGTLSPIKKVT